MDHDRQRTENNCVIPANAPDRLRNLCGIITAMDQSHAETFNLKKMLADYMEGGLLDNIVDMFRHDTSLYQYVGDLMKDERMRVRLGITALLEILNTEEGGHVLKAIPFLMPLLKDDNPVIRGDTAYILGVIGGRDVIPALREMTNDTEPNVRLIAKEAIEDIAVKSDSPESR